MVVHSSPVLEIKHKHKHKHKHTREEKRSRIAGRDSKPGGLDPQTLSAKRKSLKRKRKVPVRRVEAGLVVVVVVVVVAVVMRGSWGQGPGLELGQIGAKRPAT